MYFLVVVGVLCSVISLSKNKARNFGFSLLELVIVIAIAAIVSAIAIPLTARMVQSYQLSATTNELITAIHLTKNEALRTGTITKLCPRSVDQLTCRSSNEDWSAGWLLVSPASCTDATCVKKVWPAASGTSAVLSNLRGPIKFNGQGIARSSPGTFTLCAEDSIFSGSAKAVKVSRSGQIRVAKGQGNNCD